MSIKKLSDWIRKQTQPTSSGQTHSSTPPAHPHTAAHVPTKPPHHAPPHAQGHTAPHTGHAGSRPSVAGHEPTKHQRDFQPRNRPTKNRMPSHRAPLEPGVKQPSFLSKADEGPPIQGKKMRIIPLGGLEEVGKNIMAIEYEDDIVVIDAGMSFAGPDMMGVDYIVPDVTYLEERKRHVRAILFTHGHMDHIGAIQYVLPRLGNPPIYGTRLTNGIVLNRLADFGLDKSAKIHDINETTQLTFGKLKVEFFRVNHSIPEAVGIVVHSPAGTIVHTGDFKFDYSPAIDKPADFQRIAEIGKRGVDVLMVDSTNALKPGFCLSEKVICDTLEGIIQEAKGRLIIAAFSTLVGRINQICNLAAKYNKKVFLSGRSMIETGLLAEKLGYATYPKGVVRPITNQANSLPPSQVIILTTGAQGEAMSALTRMAIGEHANIKIREGDTVVISASPIPGNELAVVNVVNNLYSQGAKVITNGQMDVHTSGHAHQEELKLMYSLIKPRCYVPIHGEIYMRVGHADFIKTIADPRMHTTVLENGDVLEVAQQGIRKSKQKIPANDILVDGLGFGDIGSKVIQERTAMSQDGILIPLFRTYQETLRLIGEPDIISRGFLYVKESQEVAQEIKQVAKKAFEQLTASNKKWELKELKVELALHISRFIRKRLGREPMIIPVIMYA